MQTLQCVQSMMPASQKVYRERNDIHDSTAGQHCFATLSDWCCDGCSKAPGSCKGRLGNAQLIKSFVKDGYFLLQLLPTEQDVSCQGSLMATYQDTL